ncbi:MAG TPA: adenylate/guanylate cyclase domain-containing protein, partial [Rhodopila sp.]|nr:adenylate/guanylate cyclase domain-containing protein [Rhodopila sp.]
KRGFERLRPYLFCVAVMLPSLALLGFYQGGRRVMALQHDAAWRAANLAPWQVGQAAQNAMLRWERNVSLEVVLGLLLLVLLLRAARAWREQRAGLIRVSYPDGRVSRVPPGFSILEASRAARIPHASVCGGRARCSTCRVRIVEGLARLSPPQANEQAVLTRINARPQVRLACQTRPAGDVSVVPLLPPYPVSAALRQRVVSYPGEERFIVALVVDMRDSTRLAEARLPFDTVFIIDRFVNAIGSAVAEAGGLPNHFTGDGLIAIFGLACSAGMACRQAMDAIGRIGRNIEGLNKVLLTDMAEPIRYGIGVHGSTAVVGEVGYAESRVFTTLGEAAHVATRLESACKEFGCAAVVSESVVMRSGYDPDRFPRHELTVRGRQAMLAVHTIDDAARLPAPDRAGALRRQHRPGEGERWTQPSAAGS